MDTKAYRPDIDGLRAIAVLAVLAFHLDIDTFSGGFVGVDIFFVISGFLITQLILKEIDSEAGFSFKRFYVRRIRRLIPALLATLALTLIFGVIWLSPAQLERTAGAMVFALISLSNFYFWSETGYFDAASDTKPLLHTWSLGVEEQFYLFWPLLLVILAKFAAKRYLPFLLATIGLFSLYLNFLFASGEIRFIPDAFPQLAQWFNNGNATIFFLPPFRVFEFTIGALMVWIIRLRPKSPAVTESALLVGLLIMVATTCLYDQRTPFPTVYALAPCAGAALAIYGGQARYLGTILANPISVFLGRISYSLYLVHWPLIVYWKIYFFRDLLILDKLAITLLTVLLAYAMHHLIERPFRYARTDQSRPREFRFVSACGLVALVLMIPSAHAWRSSGWAWRVPEAMLGVKYDALETLEKHWHSGVGSEGDFTEDGISTVIIGTSFGLDVSWMLRNYPEFEVYYPGSTGHLCRAYTLPPLPEDDIPVDPPQDCPANIKHFAREYPNVDLVILAEGQHIWNSSNDVVMNELLKNVDLLREFGYDGPVVIYGERPIFSKSVPDLAFRFGRAAGFNEFATSFLMEDLAVKFERVQNAQRFFEPHNIHYYSPLPVICEEETCDMFTPDDELVFIDNGHFSPEGDAYLAQDFVAYLKSIPELTAR